MNNTKYKVRHVACNMADFHADRHRFRFEYNNKEYVVPCYHISDVVFEDSWNIPGRIQDEIIEIIYKKIDTKESHWRYPKEAHLIANEYCKAEFAG